MLTRKINLIFGFTGLSILLLFGIQIYWFRQQFEMSKNQFRLKVKDVMNETSEKIKDKNYCFQLFTRAYIKPGEGFTILKPVTRQKFSDTIPLFYSGGDTYAGGKFNQLLFSRHATADIHVKFEYHLRDTIPFKNGSRRLSEGDPQHAAEIIASNSPLFSLFDTSYVDSVLKDGFRRQDIGEFEGFGLIQAHNDSLAYSSAGERKDQLLRSKYRISLNNNLFFSKPFDLAVTFRNENRSILSKMTGLLLISSFIFLVLIAGFWYFLITIRRQKQLSDMKSDFINNMTHEFNTPLSNISLATETLINGSFSDPKKNMNYLGIINSETERLTQNMNRILQLAQAEKGKLMLHPEPIHLHQLLNNVVQTFELRSDLGQVKIVTTLNSGNDEVMADETHMINVFFNIIDNSIKYCHKSTCLISIESENTNDGITVSIGDNGEGMNADTLRKIFDRFYRASGGNRHDVKGFGLGLTYARSIVELHNGSIWATSSPGTGTKLYVQLPLIDSNQ